MTTLEWDKVGERIYQTGLDRGVLYLQSGVVVPWNGLTSMEDAPDSDLKSYYLDGIKYYEKASPGDFVGKLKAFTYPDEFDAVMGITESAVGSGLFLHEQPPSRFNLSYRTRIGNDVNGTDNGYKIHLLYNLLAVPESSTFDSLKNSPTVSEFGWSLTGTPPKLTGHRPTCHISIDSTKCSSEDLSALEDLLYGTSETDPSFPAIEDVLSIFAVFGPLYITDNGDGTWTADDPTDSYITMLDSNTFQIENADATFLDANTYDISDTNV